MPPRPISAEDLDADQRRLRDSIVSGPRSSSLAAFAPKPGEWALPGPFGPMLLDPPVGDALQQLGAAIRYAGVLPDSLRELGIVTTAAACHAAVELNAHLRLARAAGIDDRVLDAVVADEDVPDPVQSAIVQLCRSLAASDRADAALFDKVESAIGRAATFELIVLTGYYRLLATVLALYEIG